MPSKPIGKSRAMATDWMMEVFDWDSELPENDGGTTLPSIPGNITEFKLFGSPGETSAFVFMNSALLEAASASGGSSGSGFSNTQDQLSEIIGKYHTQQISKGLVALSFSRGKGRIDNQCSAVVVGQLPGCVRSGNWVIIRSVEQNEKLGLMPLVRFLGQIHTISSDIAVLESGAVVQKNSILISEWSHLLLTPVTFDLRKGYTQAAPGKEIDQIHAMQDQVAKTDADSIIDYISAMMNPYVAARAAMSLVGLLNKRATATEDMGISTVAMTMPWIPGEFLNALGYGDDVQPMSAFADGFATIIAGRQHGAAYNTGTWDGFFVGDEDVDHGSLLSPTKGVQDFVGTIPSLVNVTPPFASYVTSHNDYKDDPSLQPASANGMLFAQLGMTSAWGLIEGMSDLKFNEAYTDLVYALDSGEVKVHPVVVIRGIPLKTHAAEDYFDDLEINSIYDTFTYFEDLPRIALDSTLIISLNFTNTIDTTPTFFSLGANPQAVDALNTNATSFELLSAFRHSAEMMRFGGNERSMITQYTYANETETDWAAARITLGRVWHGLNYRMATGQLRIKDPGIPLSIGFNVQFTIGETDLVAQIDGVHVEFSVSPSGVKSSVTTITFSHLMGVNADKDCFFLPQTFFGNPYIAVGEETGSAADLWSGF